MRRRSPTNSRKAEDLAYREWYRQQAPYDELLPYFPIDSRGRVKVPGHDEALPMHDYSASDIHHAWSGNRGRWDRVWNLVAVCRPVHRFCEQYKPDGRILVLRQKLDRGLFDADDAYRCLGMHPLGWAEGVTCNFDWCERIRMSLIQENEQCQ